MMMSILGSSGCRNADEAPASPGRSDSPVAVEASPAGGDARGGGAGSRLRVATFNIWELSAEKVDQVDAEGKPSSVQLLAAAEILRRVRPDILLLNEIDYSSERDLAGLFVERFLASPHPSLPALEYPHRLYLDTNTGVQSGYDFDRNGEVGDPEDAWGFGRYPGQYGMALLSRLPIDHQQMRTFRLLRWSTMPGHLMPDGRDGRPSWYPAEEARQMRLSSKSHWDVPVELESGLLHVLASHPTPPVFDGPEDRNGRRNFDEIRLWADYLDGESAAPYLVDDAGMRGGLPRAAHFVILGDLNADPAKDPAAYGRSAIAQLLDHPRVQDPEPRAAGSIPVAQKYGDGEYPGDPQTRTSGFGRIDYVLPSRELEVLESGVFLPEEGDPLRRHVIGEDRASDHFLVWVDLQLPLPTPSAPAGSGS